MADASSAGFIAVSCKGCGKRFRAPAAAAGRRGKCPQCGAAIEVPHASEAAPPVVTARPVAGAAQGAPVAAALPAASTPDLTVAARKGTKVAIIGAAGLVGVIVLAIVGYVIFFGQSGGRSDLGPVGGPAPAGASAQTLDDWMRRERRLPDLPKRIVGQLPLEVVSVRMARGEESFNIYPSHGTMRVYTVRAVLRNTGSKPLVLGGTAALVESNADGLAYDGVIQGHEAMSSPFQRTALRGRLPFGGTGPRNAFVVSQYQPVDDDNDCSISLVLGDLVLFSSGGARSPSFGVLAPGERCVLVLNFKLVRIVKDEFLRSAFFASPVVYAPSEAEGPAAMLVWQFKPPAGGNLDGTWTMAKFHQSPLDQASLETLAQNDEIHPFMRVLGASWLGELHGPAGFAALRTRLPLANERAGDVRAAAISALGRARDTGSAGVFRKMLRDPEEPVGIRARAAAALGHLGLEEALDDLVAVVRAEVKAEDDKKLDNDAIRAIGCIGTPRAIQLLAGIVKGADLDRASSALSALEDCGSPAVPVVIEAARDSRERVAERAATALGYLMKTRQEKDRTEPALSLLQSDDEADETRAARIRDGSPDLPEADCRTLMAALEQSLSNSSSGVRNTAAGALAKVPGKAAGETICRIIAASSNPPSALLEALGQRREPNAAAMLSRFIRPDAPKEPCETACRVLGNLRAAEARGDLEKLAMNTAAQDPVRQAALRALEKLEGGPGEACLLALAREVKGSLRWDALERLCDWRSSAAQAAVAAAIAETDPGGKYRRDELQKRRDRAAARGSPTLASRLASKDDGDRAEAISEVRDRRDRSALPDLKRAAVAETDPACLWRVRAALADLGCRDRDLVRPMVDKLKSGPENIRRPVAAILRYLTGITDGPFTNETDTEIAEDIAAWAARR